MIPLPPTAARLITAAIPNGVPLTVIALDPATTGGLKLRQAVGRVLAVDDDGYVRWYDAEQVSFDGLTPDAQKGTIR